MLPFISSRRKSEPSGEDRHSRSIRRLSRLGYGTAVLGLGTFVSWAVLAQVASAVIAKGTVAVASTRKSIEHLTGGIVSTIDVEEGQVVRKGQRLLTLEATETAAQIDILRSRYVAAFLTDLRLKAEVENEESFAVELPTRTLLSDLTGEAGEARFAEAFETEARVFATRLATRQRQIEIYANQKRQFAAQVEKQSERLDRLDAQIRDAAKQIESTRELVGKGFVSTSTLVTKQADLGELEDQRAAIAIQRDQARSSLDGVDLERLKADQTRQEEIGKQLSETRAEAASLKVQLDMQRQLLTRTEIRSPQDGVVQNLRVRALGAVVTPGVAVMEIVPTSDDLVVSMQLPVNYADQVKPGMPANLRFSGLQSFHTMQMTGTVLRISPDAVPDEQGRRTIVNGEVRLDMADAPADLTERLRPGIEAEIVIPTAERTVASYLTRPLTDAFAHSMRER
ncbi:HlyD family type I secretion periplasmic adaptor subunit [Aureimonas pseudogalii]|uniref:Membrane fusion protein (MFP) family protein n=1 Tax=Aureimonas pseudogalii TaxID=1744844 RepID=A0A7W6H4L8_9HYPH|nr:HlyD family type I secretion periplasmic adaptor subunit [Aureimonas pseudogalii]MBB3998508.1 HlyD family type I secretion membrane fusion protein [Aureimonas pseudogalii]